MRGAHNVEHRSYARSDNTVRSLHSVRALWLRVSVVGIVQEILERKRRKRRESGL